MGNIDKHQQKEITHLIKKIAKEVIAPQALDSDRTNKFPWDAIRELGKAQLPALVLLEKEKGLGGGRLEFVSIVQEIAKACASTALVFTSHIILLKAIEGAGSDFLKHKWLEDLSKCKSLGAWAVHEPECGSNAGAISTKAVKEGNEYIVNGSKFFITSGEEAHVYMVLVRTDPEKGPKGMSTLLIEKNTPGLSFGRAEEKMGLKSTSSKEMFFNNCRIPVENLIGEEGKGLEVIGKSVIGWGFFGAAAISSGLATAALEKAVKHAKNRTIAGQPI
ncbi:MAG: acyl-CoA dehydrogenase, partial [Desulfobacteraceae bacterium]|nr:acyl-CoA dehydrogenase [Desulfobacteraceae bacterium]